MVSTQSLSAPSASAGATAVMSVSRETGPATPGHAEPSQPGDRRRGEIERRRRSRRRRRKNLLKMEPEGTVCIQITNQTLKYASVGSRQILSAQSVVFKATALRNVRTRIGEITKGFVFLKK